MDMNATLRWTLPPDLLILNYDDEAVTEAPLQPEDVTIGSVHTNIVYLLIPCKTNVTVSHPPCR